MKRFAIVLSLVVGAALFLSACDISVTPTPTPTPPTPDETATAGTNPASVVRSKTLASGASWLYEIRVPSSVRDNSDVLYLELNKNLDIRVRAAGGNLLFSSSSDQYFGRSGTGLTTSALATEASDVGGQAITQAPTCRGSCVIFQPGSRSTYLLEVTNNRSSSVSYDLFAFGDDFADPYEPANNSLSGAALLAVGPGLSEDGAIETVGDEDYWRVVGNAALRFESVASALGIRAELRSASGNFLNDYSAGTTINVSNGDSLRVYANPDRAAAAGSSRYFFSTP